MKALRLLAAIALFAISLEAMNIKDEIIYINIGGYKIDTTRSTIETSGGEYLKTLLSGKFAITKDKNGRIFIDRPQQEAELIQYFIRNLSLPKTFDPNVAQNAANYFQINAMLQYAKENTKKEELRSIKAFSYFSRLGAICPSCQINLSHWQVIEHFVNKHHFPIINHYSHPYHGEFYYTLLYSED